MFISFLFILETLAVKMNIRKITQKDDDKESKCLKQYDKLSTTKLYLLIK